MDQAKIKDKLLNHSDQDDSMASFNITEEEGGGSEQDDDKESLLCQTKEDPCNQSFFVMNSQDY